MRYGIFSDVHSNLEALEAVLDSLARDRPDELLCAGDIVGYAADPAECVARVRQSVSHAVCGNHDWAVAGKMNPEWFNSFARSVVEWTAARLGGEGKAYLGNLPLCWSDGRVTLVHGSLDKPEEFHYVLDGDAARACLGLQATPVAFIGHTHVPGFFLQEKEGISFVPGAECRVRSGQKLLVNVGSVGQPRDRDPRAAYCLYDTESRLAVIKRVPYDIPKAQEKIRSAGLPVFLAERLTAGC